MRVVLLLCVLLTGVTVVCVCCMVWRRKQRGKVMVREEASAIDQEMQTPKLSRDCEFMESQDGFVEVVEDPDSSMH